MTARRLQLQNSSTKAILAQRVAPAGSQARKVRPRALAEMRQSRALERSAMSANARRQRFHHALRAQSLPAMHPCFAVTVSCADVREGNQYVHPSIQGINTGSFPIAIAILQVPGAS